MANIDWGTLTLGALIGIGCRKQLKSCGRVAATAVANLAGVAADAAAQVAAETKSKTPEETAAKQWTQQMYQKIDQQMAVGNGQNG